jgi:hypothetical protein
MKLATIHVGTLAPREIVQTRKDQIIAVFEFWRSLLSNPRSRMDLSREKKIGSMLTIGYSVEDLQLACIGCYFSDFHRGQNDRHTAYQDIGLICRDAEHVDKFLAIADRQAEHITDERARNARYAQDRQPPSAEARAKIDTIMAKLKERK